MKRYKLGDLIEVTRGASLAGQYYASEGSLIRLTLGNFDYSHGGFKNNTSKNNLFYIGEVKPEYILNKGDIITPLTEQTPGLLGTTARIPESGKYIQSQDVALIRCKEGQIDPSYCFYLISSESVKKQLGAAAQQTKIRHTSPDRIKEVIVDIPSLEEQRAIGRFLDILTEKIENAKAINDYLEAMARQLYDYWFVQFDFPDEDGKPYKSSGGKMVWNEKLKREIPANWRGSNICVLADILSGGTPSKAVSEYWNGSIPFFGPTDYKGGVFQLSTEEHITENGLTHCASSLFDIGTIMLTARGSIGKLVVVGTPMAMNQSCYALKSRKDEWEYLYFLTKQLIQHLFLKGGGSVFKSITTVDIETSILCIGEGDVISHFTEVVRPAFQKIKNNSEEIERMTREKEELLPLLMNGQVSVRPLNNHLSDRLF